jgi:nitrate/nitrite transporter NarK
MGINLALGILYAWSVIKAGIPDSWAWTNADKALPYSVACLVFALTMVPAGRLQDRLGPRWVATLGGLLCGAGCIVAALAGSSLAGFVLGFGVLVGAGIGCGYAGTTPPAVKWVPPRRTGLVAGIVVAGVGLAPVYIAPLATWMLQKGVAHTLLALGVGIFVVVTGLAQLLRDPPPDFQPAGAPTKAAASTDKSAAEVLASPDFYTLWLLYFAGAAAGLTFFSVAQELGQHSLGQLAFVAVVVLSVGNAGGRVLAGLVSDKIGRPATLCGAFLLQAVTVTALYFARGGAGWPVILAIVVVLGANYGANLSLFPSAAKDCFGLKNFGLNYGLLFSAWGLAGLTMPWLNGWIRDATGSGDLAYAIIIALLLAGATLTFLSRLQPKPGAARLSRSNPAA